MDSRTHTASHGLRQRSELHKVIPLFQPLFMEPSSLTSIPLDILLECLQLLDDEGLYHTGLTCKHLHYPAFSTFLKRHKINDPMNMCYYLHANEYPPLLLSVVQAALWIKDIQHITCGINAGYDRIWNDVEDLNYLVGKRWPIRMMKLHLRYLDGWASVSQKNADTKALDRTKWANRVTELLDAAIAHGCSTLEVNGGHSLHRLYLEEKAPGITETAGVQNFSMRGQTARKGLVGSLKQAAAWISRQTQKTQPKLQLSTASPGPCLKSVTFSYTMLFQDSFYPWTLRMFAKNASTITRLSFQIIVLEAETFSRFLSSISLPQLGHLQITAHLNQPQLTITQTVKFSDFLTFFEKHPSIETLDLQGVELPEAPAILETRLLPQLKKIVAHSVWISTLFGHSDRFPTSFPLIESIGITTEYASFVDPIAEERVYALIDDALDAIARASFSRTITLELQLKTKRGMLDWLHKHSSLGKANSVISSLGCVSTLVLTSRFYVCFGDEVVSHLPTWLALFPALRIVNIPDLQHENNRYTLFDDGVMLKKITAQCPTLEKVESILASVDLGNFLIEAEQNTSEAI